ncbi:MAG: ZPR1 zinc finger domain-containing protein [Candidatus Woesearchaeota archaeon]
MEDVPDKDDETASGEFEQIKGEPCPFCHQKTLTLIEAEREIPYFGKCYLFSMDCSNCHYHKSDVETEEQNPPAKYTLEIDSEEDMKIRVVKSSTATVKIPFIGSIEPGEASNGYVTNVEGILNRIKYQIESAKEIEEDPEVIKKAKNMLKKLAKVMWGQEKIKLIIEDPHGNSTIISDKAVKSKL